MIKSQTTKSLINATLRPDLSVTVSLSNEMWHSGFVGGQFAELMGHTTGLGRYCWYVGRTVEIAWEGAFKTPTLWSPAPITP